ncbi:MAG: hypothetical protein CSA19_02055, partial [Deltaproteobacteria bacterium]
RLCFASAFTGQRAHPLCPGNNNQGYGQFPLAALTGKKSGLNENKLNQGFRQEFGMTVYQYYQQCRIIRAQELLDEGRLNLDTTAQMLGFSDTSHFIRQFKRYFGIPPPVPI